MTTDVKPTPSTEDLIQRLSGELSPTKPMESAPVFLLKWIAAAATLTALFVWLMPTRADLTLQLARFTFFAESLTWFALALASAYVVYRNRIPGLSSEALNKTVSIVAVAAIVVLAYNLPTQVSQESWHEEMSFYRGRCGFLITALALVWGVGLFFWAKRGAVTSLASTGAWIGFSSGCLGSFAMQIVCAHTGSLHAIIWHVVPVTIISGLAAAIGKRLLRW
jgi:hypothetical protein